MPETLTESASFDATIVVPVDGENATMATVKAFVQKLVNRSKYLKELLEPTSPTARTVYVDPSECMTPPLTNDWSFSISGGYYAQTESNGAYIVVPLKSGLVPSGATLTSVRALVKPGAARAGGSRMTIRAYRGNHDFTTPAVSTSTGLGGATVEDNGTTNVQVIGQTGLSEAIDHTEQKTWSILIVGGSDAGTNKDRVYAIEVGYTDPGPRNY
jgi:hypothetical protein